MTVTVVPLSSPDNFRALQNKAAKLLRDVCRDLWDCFPKIRFLRGPLKSCEELEVGLHCLKCKCNSWWNRTESPGVSEERHEGHPVLSTRIHSGAYAEGSFTSQLTPSQQLWRKDCILSHVLTLHSKEHTGDYVPQLCPLCHGWRLRTMASVVS